MTKSVFLSPEGTEHPTYTTIIDGWKVSLLFLKQTVTIDIHMRISTPETEDFDLVSHMSIQHTVDEYIEQLPIVVHRMQLAVAEGQLARLNKFYGNYSHVH